MNYKLYFIDKRGHFSKAIDLDCEGDEAAWAAVKEHAPKMKLELWQGARVAGSAEPGQEPVPPS